MDRKLSAWWFNLLKNKGTQTNTFIFKDVYMTT